MGRKISKVLIENFQSHEFTEIDFGHFNGIIGPTDNGKSAVIRAIVWALYNNPSGDSFIRKGQDKCQVTIVFDDGASIVKTRTSKSHSYDLCEPNGEPVHLEAFGVGPVDEVVAFHRMGFVDLFGERQSLNLCNQLDAPFFLGESPTTKALIIGRLGNTEVIDKAIKNNAADTREVKAQEKIYKKELRETNQEIKELKNLDKMERAIEFAKVKLDRIKVLEMKNANILDLSSKIKAKTEQINELSHLINADEVMNKVMADLDDLIKEEKRVSNIKEISLKIRQGERRIEELSKSANVDVDEIIKLVEPLDDCIQETRRLERVKTVSSRMDKLTSDLEDVKLLASREKDAEALILSIDETIKLAAIRNSMLNTKKKLDELNARRDKGERIILNLETSYKGAVDEYKSAIIENERCPICLSKTSEEQVKDIEKFI